MTTTKYGAPLREMVIGREQKIFQMNGKTQTSISPPENYWAILCRLLEHQVNDAFAYVQDTLVSKLKLNLDRINTFNT